MSDQVYLQSVAIIGAGMAGLTCATALQGLVRDVKVFEKEVFAGGRVNRFREREFEFNHGAQYFTVNHPLFWNIVQAWQSAGIVRPWDGWVVELNKGQVLNSGPSTQRFVGVPRMQVIIENLVGQCEIRTSTRVAEMEKQPDGRWLLFNDRGGYLGEFDAVIFATTANDLDELSRYSSEIKTQADKVDMTACWTGMFAFQEKLDIPYDAAFVLDSPLSWISRHQLTNQSESPDCWVLHATPEWSQKNLASFRGRIMHQLLEAFWQATGLEKFKPIFSSVHCWKMAAPINPIKQDCLFDEENAIGACGDWCTAARIEGAVLSGFSMADRVMKFLNKPTLKMEQAG